MKHTKVLSSLGILLTCLLLLPGTYVLAAAINMPYMRLLRSFIGRTPMNQLFLTLTGYRTLWDVFQNNLLISVILILFLAMIGLSLIILITMKSPEDIFRGSFLRSIDYSILVLVGTIFTYMISGYLLSFSFDFVTFPQLFLFIPLIGYFVFIFLLTELLIRIKQKTLLSNLYWFQFLNTFPIYRPLGLITVILLACQIFLLLYYEFVPIRLLSLLTICVLTYLAAYITTLSKKSDQATEERLRSERFKSELITNVSHDIRTPLTSIINYVDLLGKEELPEQSVEYVKVLVKKSNRLKTLIDDLMEASKASTGSVELNLQKVNLEEIVGQVSGEFDEQFEDKELTLVLRQPEEPIHLLTDSRHLYRILENLFSNTTKYSLTGTRVFVELLQLESATHILIQNTASNPLELSGQELTEQFIRGDQSRKTEGNGLGLYIAKSLVEIMGGSLTVTVIGDLFQVEVILN